MNATRELGGLAATEEAALPDAAELDPAERVAFAGARAWLSLSDALLGAARLDEAMAAAQSGIEELGRSYRSPLVKDDTQQRLRAAEGRQRQSAARQAAEMAAGVLRERIAAFEAKHGLS